jgi:hypothetical protein
VRDEIFPHFVFYLPQRQQVITYPIAGFNDDLRGWARLASLRLDVGRADHLGPFIGFADDEFLEFSGCHLHRH